MARVEPLGVDDCWPWSGAKSTAGYGHFYIDKIHYSTHRAAFELFVGPIPDGHFVCHRCDNPPCVNPAHLWAGTCLDNVQDMIRKGRHVSRTGDLSGSRKHPDRRPRGEGHASATITEDVVRAVRRSRSNGSSLRAIAATFGIKYRQVCALVYRESWRHVP